MTDDYSLSRLRMRLGWCWWCLVLTRASNEGYAKIRKHFTITDTMLNGRLNKVSRHEMGMLPQKS